MAAQQLGTITGELLVRLGTGQPVSVGTMSIPIKGEVSASQGNGSVVDMQLDLAIDNASVRTSIIEALRTAADQLELQS